MGKRQEPFLMKAIVHANMTEKYFLFIIMEIIYKLLLNKLKSQSPSLQTCIGKSASSVAAVASHIFLCIFPLLSPFFSVFLFLILICLPDPSTLLGLHREEAGAGAAGSGPLAITTLSLLQPSAAPARGAGPVPSVALPAGAAV